MHATNVLSSDSNYPALHRADNGIVTVNRTPAGLYGAITMDHTHSGSMR